MFKSAMGKRAYSSVWYKPPQGRSQKEKSTNEYGGEKTRSNDDRPTQFSKPEGSKLVRPSEEEERQPEINHLANSGKVSSPRSKEHLCDRSREEEC